MKHYRYDGVGWLKKIDYPFSKELAYTVDERLKLGLYPDKELDNKFEREKHELNWWCNYDEFKKGFKDKEDEYKKEWDFKAVKGSDSHRFNKHDIPFVSHLTLDNNDLQNLDVLYQKIKQNRYSINTNQPVWNEEYSFDYNGNITNKDTPIGSIDYSYNEIDQLTKAGDVDYSYDLNGNLTGQTVDSRITNYTYNSDNRMVGFDNGKKIIEYNYDPIGRENVVGESTVYKGKSYRTDSMKNIYSGFDFNAVMELNSSSRNSGQGINEYTYAGNKLLDRVELNSWRGQLKAEDKRYYYQDVLGSTVMTVDGKGRNVKEFNYTTSGTAYGNRINDRDRLFTGKPLDLNTGLYNYGFRNYSSLTGRFTSIDPIKDSINWYLYCGADPVNFVDLLGLCKDETDNTNNLLTSFLQNPIMVIGIYLYASGAIDPEVIKNNLYNTYAIVSSIVSHPEPINKEPFTYYSSFKKQNEKARDFFLNVISIGSGTGTQVSTSFATSTTSLALQNTGARITLVDLIKGVFLSSGGGNDSSSSSRNNTTENVAAKGEEISKKDGSLTTIDISENIGYRNTGIGEQIKGIISMPDPYNKLIDSSRILTKAEEIDAIIDTWVEINKYMVSIGLNKIPFKSIMEYFPK